MKLLLDIALWTLLVLRIGINGSVALTGVKWNKRLQVFEPISGAHSYEDDKKQRILQSRQEETHNFNGEPLRLVSYEKPGFFEFYDNDTKVRGVCGDIWTILSHRFNFTMILKKVDRHSIEYAQGQLLTSFKKMLRHVENNQSDIIPKLILTTRPIVLRNLRPSPVMWTNKLLIFARPYWKGKRDWMFDVFSMETWSLVVIVIMILSLANVVTQKVLTRNRILEVQNCSYFAHLFYTFGSLCNQGSGPDNPGSGSRILTLTVSIFCWLTLVAHGACLVQGMTQETIDIPFTDFATLLENTNLQIVVVNGSVGYGNLVTNNFKVYRIPVPTSRMTFERTLDDVYRKVCSHPDKYVLYEEEDAVAMSKMTACELFPVTETGLPMYVASGINPRVKYRRTLEIGILRLLESDVISRIRNQYIVTKITEFKVRQIKMQIIDMYRVTVIFSILGFAILASIVICVIENIVFTMKNGEIALARLR